MNSIKSLFCVFSSNSEKRLEARQAIARYKLIYSIVSSVKKAIANITQRSASDYVHMQKKIYERFSSADDVNSGDIRGDFVVGNWREHDEWTDFEDYLMKYVPSNETFFALEYGCGPGRNIRRWSNMFRRIDGVDISQNNLNNALKFLDGQISPDKRPNLFLTDGMNCGDAPINFYDFAFSTICLQHICVHEVRFSILSSLYKSLKPDGRLSIQMGFGSPSPLTRPYYDNYYAATTSNRGCDVEVNNPDDIRFDLDKIGFTNYEYWIRPVGPGDLHPNWIFFTAMKP